MSKKIFAFVLIAFICSAFVAAQNADASFQPEQTAVEAVSQNEAAETSGTSQSDGMSGAIRYVAAALAVGLACIGGAMAVGKIGAAAMGAMSENAELSGKALPFVGLAEGICLWGFLVALFIIIM